jgi:hypothetical protein
MLQMYSATGVMQDAQDACCRKYEAMLDRSVSGVDMRMSHNDALPFYR